LSFADHGKLDLGLGGLLLTHEFSRTAGSRLGNVGPSGRAAPLVLALSRVPPVNRFIEIVMLSEQLESSGQRTSVASLGDTPCRLGIQFALPRYLLWPDRLLPNHEVNWCPPHSLSRGSLFSRPSWRASSCSRDSRLMTTKATCSSRYNHFFANNPLYDSVFTQYGPFYF